MGMNLEAITPIYRAEAVTPHDTNYIEQTRGLYVGVSGDVVVTMADGNDVTFTALAGGIVHPIQCIRVQSTSTTATDIVACY